jgi:hypothetical protein
MTLAAQSEPTDLSFALAPLQQVAASLRRARAGWLPTRDERAHLFAMIPRLGPAVFPQLLRSLGSDCDDEAHWAGQLLRQASVPEVAVRLRKLLTTSLHPDSVKARALAILADLGLSPPQDVVLVDPEGFIARSVSELLGTIESADDLLRTINDLLTAVPTEELLPVLREVVCHGGEMGAALLEAVLLDQRTPDAIAAELCGLCRPTREVTPRPVHRATAVPMLAATRQARTVPPVHRHPSRRALLDALPIYRQVKPRVVRP